MSMSEGSLKVGETRFHWGKNRREICISTDTIITEDWVVYDSEEGREYHDHRLDALLKERFNLTTIELIEILKKYNPEKLI